MFGATVFGVIMGLFVIWLSLPFSPQMCGKRITHIKTKEKVVALTFDDGPNPPTTNEILAVLKKHNVPATFFVVGKQAEQHPDMIKAIYTAGHELGNHTWSHEVLICKSASYIRKEITDTDNLLRSLGYTGPIHFRSPKGMKLVVLSKVLAHMKRNNILFDVAGYDWEKPGTKAIVNNVLSQALMHVRPGSIILLHDGSCSDKKEVVNACDIIIERLQQRGYKFLRISELLAKRKIK